MSVPGLPITVKKFGGTSVGTLERIESVADRIVADKKEGESPVVIVSAMAGETNRLVGMAQEIHPQHRGAAYDMLLASGEQVSVSLLAMALEKRGVKCTPYLAYQLGILTDNQHAQARIRHIRTEKILEQVQAGTVPVVAGFQGVTAEEQLTTLGRGGSDTTAVALAAALNLSSCEIFTDVPAICSADPRWVPHAHEVKKLSFIEMLEMSSLGARILHVRSVEVATNYNIRLHVRTAFEKRVGTWVVPEEECMEDLVVTAVTHDTQQAVLELFPIEDGPQPLASLFRELSQEGIVVDVITQSRKEAQQRLAFSVPIGDVAKAVVCVQAMFPKVQTKVLDQVAKVGVVGVGMRTHPGVAATFFEVFKECDVPIHLVTTSEIKIGAIIDRVHLHNVMQKLHTAFGLDV